MAEKQVNCKTGFRKSHVTQHLLITLLEKWEMGIGKGNYVSALFLKLSKTFGTINHDLMLAKLNAYGFSQEY